MTVAELIKELEKMPQDKEVIMLDGPAYYTQTRFTSAIGKKKGLTEK